MAFGAFEQKVKPIGKKRGILQGRSGVVTRKKKGRIQFGPVEEHEFDESSTPAGKRELNTKKSQYLQYSSCGWFPLQIAKCKPIFIELKPRPKIVFNEPDNVDKSEQTRNKPHRRPTAFVSGLPLPEDEDDEKGTFEN